MSNPFQPDTDPVRVSCAIIRKGEKYLAAQRSREMSHPSKWEFPGGKIEEGESPESCLIREIEEELQIRIRPVKRFDPVDHRYHNRLIRLIPMICVLEEGDILLTEHSAFIWLKADELHLLDWADADRKVLDLFLAEFHIN
jgi:8-oxo-dGTP diphosphatase